MRGTIIALLASILLTPIASLAESPQAPSLGDLTRAGSEPYEARRPPESFAQRLLDALKHSGEAHGGGLFAGAGYEQARRRIDIDMTASDLLAHFATQLNEAGWLPTLIHHDGPIALQAWRFTDDSGRSFHALMLVEEVAEPELTSRNVTLRLTRIAAPGPQRDA